MKTIKLHELLTESQLNKVEIILREPPTFERTNKLKDYLCSIREGLEAQGVLPEYLVYVIEYHQMVLLSQFEQVEMANAKNN